MLYLYTKNFELRVLNTKFLHVLHFFQKTIYLTSIKKLYKAFCASYLNAR